VSLTYPSLLVQTLSTNTSSIAFIDLPNGNYFYTASSNGYSTTISLGFTINNGNFTTNVNFQLSAFMQGNYTLTILTSGIGYGVQWFFSLTQLIGGSGVVTYGIPTPNYVVDNMSNGSYAYTASSSGYNSLSGSFVINGNNTTILLYFTPYYGNGGNQNNSSSSLISSLYISIGILGSILVIMAVSAYYGGTIIGLTSGFIVLIIGKLLGYIPTWIIIAVVVASAAALSFKAFLSNKNSDNEGK
jgi:hypothetical protein